MLYPSNAMKYCSLYKAIMYLMDGTLPLEYTEEETVDLALNSADFFTTNLFYTSKDDKKFQTVKFTKEIFPVITQLCSVGDHKEMSEKMIHMYHTINSKYIEKYGSNYLFLEDPNEKDGENKYVFMKIISEGHHECTPKYLERDEKIKLKYISNIREYDKFLNNIIEPFKKSIKESLMNGKLSAIGYLARVVNRITKDAKNIKYDFQDNYQVTLERSEDGSISITKSKKVYDKSKIYDKAVNISRESFQEGTISFESSNLNIVGETESNDYLILVNVRELYELFPKKIKFNDTVEVLGDCLFYQNKNFYLKEFVEGLLQDNIHKNYIKGGKARHNLTNIIKYQLVLPLFIRYYPYGKITKQTVKNIAENRVYKLLTNEDFALAMNNLQVDFDEEKVIKYLKNNLYITTTYKWCLHYSNWRKKHDKDDLQEYYNCTQNVDKNNCKEKSSV